MFGHLKLRAINLARNVNRIYEIQVGQGVVPGNGFIILKIYLKQMLLSKRLSKSTSMPIGVLGGYEVLKTM